MPTRISRIVPTEARGELAESLQALRDELELPRGFSPEVQAEAEQAARAVSTDPAQTGLVDLRSIEFLTIDPAGSTDLDQALHLERTATGGILHYAIADLPTFVTPNGALDLEARQRGQTMYAPDGRIPLHPPVLSESATSLLPGVDRRAYVWRIELDPGARPIEATLIHAVIRSRQQWAYDQAQAAIDAGEAPDSLQFMKWFGTERAARESERGGASLNVPESRIIAEGNGYRLERSHGVPLEEWNSQVSLLAGMTAASIMLDGGIGILRTMPPASEESIETFRAQTHELGLPWPEHQSYGAYLRELDRSPAARAVKEYAGSLFRGAGYVTFDGEIPEDVEQAAIGAPYAHVTAPLRRLVDRWALLICHALVTGTPIPAWLRESLPTLPGLMSKSAGRAGRLDSGSLDRVEAALLIGHEGEVCRGLVLRNTGTTARVQLRQPPVEVSVSGLSAQPGEVVMLRLDSVDVATAAVGFTAVDDPEEA